MNKKGQALVEFALLLIPLFLLVFGIFQFGYLMYTKNTLTHAARAAARAAVVKVDLNTTADTNYSMGFITKDTVCDTLTDTVARKICEGFSSGIDKSKIEAVVKSTNYPPKTGDAITVTITLHSVPSFVPRFITVADTLSGTAALPYE
jgi:Flp pilus assembly protein TadG